MRISFERPLDPPEVSAADERQDAQRLVGLYAKRQKRDDTEENKDREENVDDEPLPGDFETQEEYEDALEDAGIDPDDAPSWDERQEMLGRIDGGPLGYPEAP